MHSVSLVSIKHISLVFYATCFVESVDVSTRKLTSANLGQELSADVTHSEHIYHWLKKQNDSMAADVR